MILTDYKPKTHTENIDAQSGRVLVEVDPRYFRPTEVDALLGDPSKAREQLGWQHSTNFQDLVREMIEVDRAAHTIFQSSKELC